MRLFSIVFFLAGHATSFTSQEQLYVLDIKSRAYGRALGEDIELIPNGLTVPSLLDAMKKKLNHDTFALWVSAMSQVSDGLVARTPTSPIELYPDLHSMAAVHSMLIRADQATFDKTSVKIFKRILEKEKLGIELVSVAQDIFRALPASRGLRSLARTLFITDEDLNLTQVEKADLINITRNCFKICYNSAEDCSLLEDEFTELNVKIQKVSTWADHRSDGIEGITRIGKWVSAVLAVQEGLVRFTNFVNQKTAYLPRAPLGLHLLSQAAFRKRLFNRSTDILEQYAAVMAGAVKKDKRASVVHLLATSVVMMKGIEDSPKILARLKLGLHDDHTFGFSNESIFREVVVVASTLPAVQEALSIVADTIIGTEIAFDEKMDSLVDRLMDEIHMIEGQTSGFDEVLIRSRAELEAFLETQKIRPL